MSIGKTGAARTGSPSVGGAAGAALALTLLLFGGCSPDLQENLGPLVPVPNVTGTVLRAGSPVADRKVKLIETASDSTWDSARTDALGYYAFSAVGAGDWTVDVSSSDSLDFASVTSRFVFATEDTSASIPALDLSLHGLKMKKPDTAAPVPRPTFLSPVEFEWELPDLPNVTVQIRLYTDAYEPVWFSEKLTTGAVAWNGLCNQGDFRGRPVAAGSYLYRLRVEPDEGAEEMTTSFQPLVFE